MKSSKSKRVLIIESDEAAANEIASLIATQSDLESVRVSDLQSAKNFIEEDPNIKMVFSLYEVSDNQEQRRDFFIQNLISKKRKDIQGFSVGTINRSEFLLSHNKALLITTEGFKASIEGALLKMNESSDLGTQLATQPSEGAAMKKKNVLLLTENKDSDFSKKVAEAVQMSNLELSVSEPSFRALAEVKGGAVGVVVLDLEELGQLGNDFFRAVRMFHLTTPMLLAGSKLIFLDQTMTYRFERKIESNHLNELITKAIAFSEMIDETEEEFFKRLDGIRHLTGEELTKATDKIRKDIFGDIYRAKTEEIEPKTNAIKTGFGRPPENEMH